MVSHELFMDSICSITIALYPVVVTVPTILWQDTEIFWLYYLTSAESRCFESRWDPSDYDANSSYGQPAPNLLMNLHLLKLLPMLRICCSPDMT